LSADVNCFRVVVVVYIAEENMEGDAGNEEEKGNKINFCYLFLCVNLKRK